MLYPGRLSAFRLHDGDFSAIAPQAADRIAHGQSLAHLLDGPRECPRPGKQAAKERDMPIRNETPECAAVIRRLEDQAFRNTARSSEKEGKTIAVLRAAEAHSLSLVAEEDGQVLGHVAVSPVLVGGADRGWQGHGPVSVRPDRQGEGI